MRAFSHLLASAAVLATTLLIGTPARADVETFRLQWASYQTFVTPIWTSATTTVSLEPWIAPDGSGTGYHLFGAGFPYEFFFLCVAGNPEQCQVAGAFSPYQGSLAVQRNYPGPGDANITLDIEFQGHVSGRLIGVGNKAAAEVFITQPRSGATVSGTVWVVLWAEGTSGTSNTFTLSADGRQVLSQTTSSRGPVTLPWLTTPAGAPPVPNGTHTLTGTVRDATGRTATTSITVIVKN